MWPKDSLQQLSAMSIISLTAVLTILVEATQAQAFLLSLGQRRTIYPYRDSGSDSNNRNVFGPWSSVEIESAQKTDQSGSNSTNTVNAGRQDYASSTQDDNSTIFFVKNTNTSELSQTAMDVITIVWYVATFLALAAFFLLMACSDKRCCDFHRNAGTRNGNNNNEAIPTPPTPSPSYSEFAPPSYETVMKMQHPANRAAIYVIPLSKDDDDEKDSNSNNNGSSNISSSTTTTNNNNNNAGSQLNTPTTPSIVNFYTINELQKFGNSS